MADSTLPNSTNPSPPNATNSPASGDDTNPGNKGSGPSPQAPQESGTPSNTEAATFPRSYVEELRSENAAQRVKAQRSDKLAALLVAELARGTGLMADPRDLVMDDNMLEDGIPDEQKVREAVERLLAERPHLRDRRPTGSIDQGARTQSDASVSDLGAILRNRAG